MTNGHWPWNHKQTISMAAPHIHRVHQVLWTWKVFSVEVLNWLQAACLRDSSTISITASRVLAPPINPPERFPLAIQGVFFDKNLHGQMWLPWCRRPPPTLHLWHLSNWRGATSDSRSYEPWECAVTVCLEKVVLAMALLFRSHIYLTGTHWMRHMPFWSV